MERPPVPERFEVEREIGRGGMATVYLAKDTVTHTHVALKVLHPHLRGDELIAERFRREIAAARRVNHPNVASIHDLVETDQALCLVVEYHDGIDLKRLLRRREKLTPDEAVLVIEQVLDGLTAAHSEGVVHRDVKPHNVLVDDDLNVKLTDFGLARVDNLVGLTAHTMSLGTPEYMAPELFGSHYVDSRADVYAVGVTLFEMLTGKLPFRATTPLELLDMHRSTDPPDVRDFEPNIDERLAVVVTRALKKAPEDRFATPSEMRRALDGDLSPLQMVDSGVVCRSCGAPLPPGLGICVECGKEHHEIVEDPERGYSVYIKRPRNSLTTRPDYFDTLTFEQKSKLVDEVGTQGGVIRLDAKKIDQRMRQTPIMIATHISADDARRMAISLEVLGVPARVASPNMLGRIARFRQFGMTELLGRRAVLSFMGLPLITIPLLMAYLGPDAGLAAGVAIPFLAGMVDLYRHYRYLTRPIARFGGRSGAFLASSTLIDEARQAFEGVRTARIRQLLRRILQRGLELQRRLESTDAAESLTISVDQLLAVAIRGARHIGDLEQENADIEPGAVLERMRVLDERIAESEDVHDIEEWLEEKARQRRLLETFDSNYDEITRLTERLLEVSSELSQHLGRLDLVDATELDLMSMSQVMLDLSSEVEAFVEVEEEVESRK